MGDKSPKATHKQAAQKQVKEATVKRNKDAASAAAVSASTERNGKK